jgi:H+/Cl- antiporter ClcA
MSETTLTQSPPARSGAEEAAPEIPERLPNLGHVLIMAVIAIAFAAVFLGANGALTAAVWGNPLVSANRWAIPVIVLFFSLLVGLLQRFLSAPTVIEGGFAETLKGEGPKTDYRTFPGALLSSLCSLVSGASVGPEGPITILVQQIAMWFRARLKVSPRVALGFDVAAIASALNGVVGNPLFTAAFATEYSVGGQSALMYLTWNLLAGVVGFSVYTLLRLTAFASFIAFPPVVTLEPSYFVWAVVLGCIGTLVAVIAGIGMRIFGTLMQRISRGNPIVRALAAGVVISAIGVAMPQLLFSGEDQIHTIINDPLAYGVGLLLVMALLKLLLVALSLKSGFLGGPTFPLLFSCTMIGLALHLLFPDAPLGIQVMCIEASAVTVALNAPLTAILLVAVIGTANQDTLALITLSAVIGMLLSVALKKAMEARASQHTAALSDPADASGIGSNITRPSSISLLVPSHVRRRGAGEAAFPLRRSARPCAAENAPGNLHSLHNLQSIAAASALIGLECTHLASPRSSRDERH